jgi:hypothetical protein
MKKPVLIAAFFVLGMMGYLSAQVIDDFEESPVNLTFNMMLNDPLTDSSMMTVVANPDPSGIDTSSMVVEFLRDKDGVLWDGFWSALMDSIDLSVNKYVHVMVWKPRTSPLHFKVGNGPGGQLEIANMNEQTLTNQWEDIVFDFTTLTGKFDLISFMPDFPADSVGLTSDITIYFDNIMLSNDPTPITRKNVTFTVDMTNASPFDPVHDDVYIAGDMSNPAWETPGSDMNLKLIPSDTNAMVYTITLTMADAGTQLIQYKYARVIDNVASWQNAEWPSTDNRNVILTGDMTLNDTWADEPSVVTFNVDMTNADPFDPATDDVFMAGTLESSWNMPGSVQYYKMAPTTANPMIYTLNLSLYNGDIMYKYFRVINNVPSWDNGEWTGDPNREIMVDTAMTVNDIWGSPAGIYNHPAVTFNIYPNPVNDYLNVSNLKSVDRIEIYNMTGKKIKTIENVTTPLVTIKTSDFSKGVYIINVFSKGTIQSAKFIK